MAAITIRGLPDEVHRALRVRAAQHGRSTEAEIRHILAETALPEDRIRIGSALAEIRRRYGSPDLELIRDPIPIEPATFE